MVIVAQLVRASVCGSEGRRFESGLSPKTGLSEMRVPFFVLLRSFSFHIFDWLQANE